MLSLELTKQLDMKPITATFLHISDAMAREQLSAIRGQCPPSAPTTTPLANHGLNNQNVAGKHKSTSRRNERERNRVKHINSTFSVLRQHLPASHRCAAKMSKVDTLRNAINYIKQLQDMLSTSSPPSSSSSPSSLTSSSAASAGKENYLNSDTLRHRESVHEYNNDTSPSRSVDSQDEFQEDAGYPASVSSFASTASSLLDPTESFPVSENTEVQIMQKYYTAEWL